eukprot:Colp12_sorted_trinity150504_noHs@1041
MKALLSNVRLGALGALFLFVMFVMYDYTPCYFINTEGTPSPPPDNIPPSLLPSTLPADKRYAYVTIHYEGTERDDAYVLGVRVMVQSIRMTGSKQDIVILISDNVRQSTVDTFLRAGCIVKKIENIENPYANNEERRLSFKSHFMYTLNKLRVWDLTEYERVIYLDADNIALQNMDSLFLVGHFAAVYMNPVYFHTGVLVIKPDHAKFLDMLESLSKLPSYDGADQGFLTAYFDGLSNAPVANVTGTPSNNPMERLPISYNLNHIYFYEKMNWNLYRLKPFQKLPIPGVSMGFPIAQWLKPWYWAPFMYLSDMHSVWLQIRLSLNDNYFCDVIMRIAVLIVAWAWTLTSARRIPRAALYSKRVSNIAFKLNPYIGGTMIGFLSVVLAIRLSWAMVPQLMLPQYAWPLFILYMNSLLLFYSALFANVCGAILPVEGPTAPVVIGVAIQVGGGVILNAPLYDNPATKIIALLTTIYVTIFYQIWTYTRALFSLQSRRHSDLGIRQGSRQNLQSLQYN